MIPLIVANWKMYGSAHGAQELARAVSGPLMRVERVICPPHILLPWVVNTLVSSDVAVGAQDCHAEKEGAHTGDISAPMLKDAGCRFVILGHSERRAAYNESDNLIGKKAAAAIECGLTPIICVGETQEQHAAGESVARVTRSVHDILTPLANLGKHNLPLVIAYEPIWAIGSGKTPSQTDVDYMHIAIHTLVKNDFSFVAKDFRVLYGGSVKPDNAAKLMNVDSVNGFLVGGASLNSTDFLDICRAAEEVHAQRREAQAG